MKVEFTVEAPLLGYRQTTAKTMFHPKERKRSQAYGRFKERVLLVSMEAGLPNMALAKKERPPRLSVKAYWKGEPKLDWKNLYGALEDAIWYEGDRYVVPGRHSDVVWDSGVEKAVVTVEL